MSQRLLIGSGDWHWGGNWISIDADPKSGADVIATVPPLPESVTAWKYEEILCVHMIEHIPPWSALELARECYHILEPGGVLIFEQPNILYAARVLLGLETPPDEGFPGQYDMWAFYGDPTYKNELMLHRWGYHPASMTELLVQAGFQRECVQIKPAEYHRPVRDFRAEAVR